MSEFIGDQVSDNERLEQFKRHHFRQTALADLQLRTGHDDRTSGIVDTLTKQVLAETPLLAL